MTTTPPSPEARELASLVINTRIDPYDLAALIQAAFDARDAAKWRDMRDAPLDTLIVLKQRDWVCTGTLHHDEDNDHRYSHVTHYNGTALVVDFRGNWDGWQPTPPTDQATRSPAQKAPYNPNSNTVE